MKTKFTAVLLILAILLASCGTGSNTNNSANNAADNAAANTVPDPAPQTNSVPGGSGDQSRNTGKDPDPSQGSNNNASNTEKDPNTNNVPANDPSSNTAEDQKKAEQDRYDSLYASGIRSSEDLKYFLNGTWYLIPNGALPGTAEAFAALSFDSGTSKAELTILIEERPTVYMEFSTGKLFDMADATEDLIYFDVKDASEMVRKNSPLTLDSHNQFQILTCRCMEEDYIAIREVGNGTSSFAFDILSHENMSLDGFWIFVRDGGTRSSVFTDETYGNKARSKNGYFFALRWLDTDGSCYLTSVNVEVHEDTFWEDKVKTLRYTYQINKRSLIAVRYELTDPGAYERDTMIAPQLVEVTTDASGKIIDILDHPYYSYGVYSPEIDMRGNYEEYRDPEIYGFTDETYLGSWKGKEDPSMSLTVSEASLQTGGYKFEMWLYDGDGYVLAECYANIFEGDLYVNQGHINGSYDFEGVLLNGEIGIKFNVTNSGWGGIQAGQTFFFERK